MNPMESDHEVLRVKEICDLLQFHQSTIYKMIRQGKIPSFRIGSDWRFRRDRIMRWIARFSFRAQTAEPYAIRRCARRAIPCKRCQVQVLVRRPNFPSKSSL